ncbi:hypothetical protein BO94DRAFT_537352 [Aspergillus sclerotioniger CBS 115572]|uniref:Casein kinase substrate phosphoprotein PP28 domain-containing protein n=1 Tax=Aspergillus sclerotioniger CBS 115572 TaxID=1450535 RepID=A0A317W247_9EURO|nr:hypothetical protein BO94DRAFT_537352 [Aspergillus sclerotioniger CBS 115572]PWY79342.1 hypothetical protein BO94DRAFT_537352 [Aspergillus sclerotioniger CBS 115572]
MPSSSQEDASSESESDESSDEERPGPSAVSPPTVATEMTREERRAAAKAKKQAAQARRLQTAAQPGDLPPSDSEGSDKEDENDDNEEDEDLPANPNHTTKSRSQLSGTTDDAAQPEGGDLSQLSRREREAIEAQQARERYMKLHAEGKTDEARADLARLALVRERREADRLRKEAEKEEKAELAKQRAAELQVKLQAAKGKKKGGAKKK